MILGFRRADDRNEAELGRTALLKGVPGLISVVIAGKARSDLDKAHGRAFREPAPPKTLQP